MALTRIDCASYCRSGVDPSAEVSSFVALNPRRKPGSLVAAGSCAARGSIGSQVACKLAIEHFVDGVLGYFDADEPPGENATARVELSQQVLEAAFKNANTSVYEFGHKLSAGGRMAASLLGLVIEDKLVAAGRAGPGSAFLFRAGQLFPFFDDRPEDASMEEAILRERCIGARSLVAVDLASVEARESDLIVLLSERLDPRQVEELSTALVRMAPAEEVLRTELLLGGLFADRAPEFLLLARLGPEVIYLEQRI